MSSEDKYEPRQFYDGSVGAEFSKTDAGGVSEWNELADRLWKLATAQTVAPSSVYANICREAAYALKSAAANVHEPWPDSRCDAGSGALADELEQLRRVADETPDGQPDGYSETQAAFDQHIDDHLPEILAALRTSPPPSGVQEALEKACALARRLCQLFDSGGESQRSARARHASAIFQILSNQVNNSTQWEKCDADPVAYLEACERAALSQLPATAEAGPVIDILERAKMLNSADAMRRAIDGAIELVRGSSQPSADRGGAAK